MKNNTNWYVITGGPSTGKTTAVNLLSEKGYNTAIEHARHYIDTMAVGGKTVEEIRENKLEFQQGVLKMQIEQEADLDPKETVFLDRAIPDALAYYRFLGLQPDDLINDALTKVDYKKVFILERLPFIKDYARTENESEQLHIHSLIIEVYESLSLPIVHVPVLPPEERVQFILNNL